MAYKYLICCGLLDYLTGIYCPTMILLAEVEDRTPILIIREGDPEIVHTHPPIVYYVLAYE